MSSPSPPPDNSAYIEAQREQEARDAQARADAKAAQDKADLAALRNSVRSSSGSNVDQFFRSRGVDPTAYEGDIGSQLDAILNGVSPSDPNPGSAFTTAGQDIFNNLTSGKEAQANAALDQIFQPNYAKTRINNTLTDPLVSQIFNTQRDYANNIVQNMIKRGVLTQTGGNAALGDLDRQNAGVRTKLQGFANDTLAGGQQSLDDIINAAHNTASNLKLGQTFDPTTYSTNADDVFNRFVNSLGDQINAKVGNANLFQTNGLAAIGGAAQGAGNTAYNPNAAAGIITDDTQQPQKNNNNSENIF